MADKKVTPADYDRLGGVIGIRLIDDPGVQIQPKPKKKPSETKKEGKK